MKTEREAVHWLAIFLDSIDRREPAATRDEKRLLQLPCSPHPRQLLSFEPSPQGAAELLHFSVKDSPRVEIDPGPLRLHALSLSLSATPFPPLSPW